MIYKYPQEKQSELKPFFEGHKFLKTIVLGLLTSLLGEVYVDDLQKPRNVMLKFGSKPTIIAFGGDGEGETAKELIEEIPNKSGFFIPNKKWKALLKEKFGNKLIIKPRTKLSSASLNLEHIETLKENIPEGYTIEKINKENIEYFDEKTKDKWIRFVGSLDFFKENGFGFCAKKDEKIAAEITNGGLMYGNAFEIDIETHPDHRRKGLATVLAAYMLEYSLVNGYDPRWDAANQPSVNLALKLGYTNPEEHELMVYWDD